MERDQLRDLARQWDGLAEQYVAHLYDELDHKPRDQELLARFAELAAATGGPVLDVGCGPGHVTHHLHGLGLDARGLDLSPAMVELAHNLNPEIPFEVGDMLELDLEQWSLGGAVLFYSVIHLTRDDLGQVVAELSSAVKPGGPLLIAVHGGEGILTSEEVLGEPVTMAITLFSQDEIVDAVQRWGFEVESAETRAPYPEEGATDRVYVLAIRR